MTPRTMIYRHFLLACAGYGLLSSSAHSASEDRESTLLQLCAVRAAFHEKLNEFPDLYRNGQEIYLGIERDLRLHLIVAANNFNLLRTKSLAATTCKEQPRSCNKELSNQFHKALLSIPANGICDISKHKYFEKIESFITNSTKDKLRSSDWQSIAWIHIYLSAIRRADIPLPESCNISNYSHSEIIVGGPSADYNHWLTQCFSNWDYHYYFTSDPQSNLPKFNIQ